MRDRILVAVFGLVNALSCSAFDPALVVTNPHLKYFGFSLVDVGWDDPHDSVGKTNYVDEVAGFTNVADLLVTAPQQTITARLNDFAAHGVKAIVHVQAIFFSYQGEGGNGSGRRYGLRADWRERWERFVSVNDLKSISGAVQAWYLGEEPTWNGIPYEDLKQAADHLKASVPAVPILLIEAYPSIGDLTVPQSVDWIGFDHYFLRDPLHDSTYQQELALLKTKLSRAGQQLVLVMDAHYIKSRHGAAGIDVEDLKALAKSYFQLANTNPEVVALLGYFWPGGFDDRSSLGARNLPQAVKDEYVRIGRAITGPGAAPRAPPCCPQGR